MTRIDRRTLLTGVAALGASTFAPPPIAALAAPAQAFPAVSAEAAALWAMVAQEHEFHAMNIYDCADVPEEHRSLYSSTYDALGALARLDDDEFRRLCRWALASDDPWVRELGLGILRRAYWKEEEQLADLLDMAERLLDRDQPYEVRLEALGVAASHWNLRPVPAAYAMVNDPEPEIRSSALWGLRPHWSDDRLAALAPMMRDPDPVVRQAVINVASRCFSDEDYDAMCDMAHDPEPLVRREVAWWLRRDTPRAMNALVMLTHDEDDRVRDWAMTTLGSEFDTDTAQIRAVLHAGLDDDDYGVRAEAALGLVRRRDPAGAEFVAADLRDDWCAKATYCAAALLASPAFEDDLRRHHDAGSMKNAFFCDHEFDWAIARCRGEPVERGDHVWFVPSADDAATPPLAPDQRAA